MNPDARRIAVAASKPKPIIEASDLIHLRPYVEGFLRHSWLTEQFALLDAWTERDSDPVLVVRSLHRPDGFNMLAAALWATRWWEREHAIDPSFRAPPGALRLLPIGLDLAVLELHAGSHLTADAREHVQQRMQDPNGLWGFLHEIATFGDFVRRGTAVSPHFLSNSSVLEITVHWHDLNVPVQCKVKVPGAGRKVSRERFNTFAGSLAKALRLAGAQVIVRIGSTKEFKDEDAQFLHARVLEMFRKREAWPLLVRHRQRVFSIRIQPIVASIESPARIKEFLNAYGFHAGFISAEPNPLSGHHEVTVIVGLESNPKETPWRSLRESIDAAADQLKGGPPGIVAVHYVDPTPDFEALCPPEMPAIGAYCISLIQEREHVAAVMLSTEPDLQLPKYGGESGRVVTYAKRGALPDDFPFGEPVR